PHRPRRHLDHPPRDLVLTDRDRIEPRMIRPTWTDPVDPYNPPASDHSPPRICVLVLRLDVVEGKLRVSPRGPFEPATRVWIVEAVREVVAHEVSRYVLAGYLVGRRPLCLDSRPTVGVALAGFEIEPLNGFP